MAYARHVLSNRLQSAGGKRSGADYSAESTAVREMFEETAGEVLHLHSSCPRVSSQWGTHPVHSMWRLPFNMYMVALLQCTQHPYCEA